MGGLEQWGRRLVASMLATTIVAAALSTTSPGHAQAARARPVGVWSIERDGADVVVRWTGSEPLPIGGERLEVRSGDAVIAVAREVGATAEARIERAPFVLGELELWRGNLRLDAEVDRPAGGDTNVARERDRPHTRHLAVDAGAPGPYATTRYDYDLAPLPIRGFEQPVEVAAEVTLPVGAPGARPLVMLLHGRHATCFEGGPDGAVSGDWPCPAGWQPIPSYRGYRAITQLLASQGYVTVSIAANGINAQDFAPADGGAAARAALVRHHLALWSSWAATGGAPFAKVTGRVDLTRVMLVGHSRGGEGVARAAIESRRSDPWRIIGLVPIGPTAFGRQVPATIDTMVLLPRCDGDVSDLQGQLYVDDGRDLFSPGDHALRSAVLLLGANHNFFNSEWTPGLAVAPAADDWDFTGRTDDPNCGPASTRRLSPGAQQAAGATYLAIFARLVFERDPLMLHQLDNSFGAPASAKGAAVLVTALGGDRTLLYAPRRVGSLTAGPGLSASICEGWSFDGGPTCGFDFESRTPHWIPPTFGQTLPRATAAELSWTGTRRITFATDTPIDLRGTDRIDLRVAIHPDADATWFRARLKDASGRTTWLPVSGELRGLAGSGLPAKVWAQAARLKVRGATGVDLRHIVRIDVELAAGVDGTGRGHAFLLDAAVVDQYVPTLYPAWLPRAHIQDRDFTESDAPRTIDVPVRLIGFARVGGRFWAETVGPTGIVGRWIDVPAGATSAIIPLAVNGDNVRTGDQFFSVSLAPGRNVTTGRYVGSVRIVDDELAPTVTALATTASGREGDTLTWALELSSPQPTETVVFVPFSVPAVGPELDSDDVTDAAWMQWVGAAKPSPAELLSTTFAFQFVRFPAGVTSATVEVPTVVDGIAEGPESVALQAFFDGSVVATLTGTLDD